MKLKTASAAFALIGASALVLSGCAAAPEETPTETATATESAAPTIDYLACAVSDEGSWNDKSFNESVYDGIEKAEAELGVQIADAESNSAEDFAPNLQAMVDQGCDVTFAVGFNLVADANAIAAANPEMNFVTIDGWSEGNANLKPVGYAMNQSSYLAGYVAAAYSTTKVVGTYGGIQIPAVTDFMDGFYAGAMAWGAENGVDVKVVGWDKVAQTGQFIGDFTPNSGTSKSIAAALINEGADVLFPVGGDQFGASSEAIKEAGIDGVMIGVDKDVALTSPEYASMVLTSAEKRMTNAVYDIIAELSAGGAFSGEQYTGTLANGGTGLSPFYEFDSKIDDATKARLAEIEAGIIAGEIDPLS
ncbi:MAG: BMP family ABC transporter substrate-binding protein [Aquiluna sp.]|nr:BMP family ABC transporter substrate-binding protein [Aquiluna sp.]MCF8546241.1 BMP family ABC transporter substrate-binding protein [Aquiluna sp.]